MLFQDLNLIEPILRALKTEGYTTPTPIQEQSIPIILQHKDLLGCAQTGTGKTAAFAIPILQLLYQDRLQHKEQKTIKALILTPTRELAIQINESFAAYGKHTGLKHLVIFGGVSQNPQVDALKRGVDILVATPGRLLDLMNQRFVHLEHIKMLVLDEADRMLDMGFVHDVKKVIAKIPAKRQTLFFSATMPDEIQQLANTILTKPEKVEVTPVSSTADTIQQMLYYVEKNDKRSLLAHILKDKGIKTALVFTRTKHGADKVVKDLIKIGITAEAIHGNKSQNARQRALTNFKNRTTRVLIATDIAARGIDIDELTHVINYELPNIPETYVHRIGRTGRAGASGIALSFCDEEEIEFLRDIHKLIAKEIPVEEGHPYPMSPQSIVAKHAEGKKKGPAQRGGGSDNKRSRGFGRADRGRGASGKTEAGSGMSGASRGGNRGGRRD
jgi:ATP-dependent RNA helicase RhlE